ncbi:MAG: hypothetical protein AAFP22_14195 [Planctomycetota bacterium]
MPRPQPALVILALLCTPAALAQGNALVDFEDGTPGHFEGYAVDATGGNPGSCARIDGLSSTATLMTGRVAAFTNPTFQGDYSGLSSVTFSIDVKVDRIDLLGIGIPEERSFGVWLSSWSIFGNTGPSGVYYELGRISAALQPDWTTFSVTIEDPTLAVLPPGWRGSGQADAGFTNPRLPAGATFATVLADVEILQFTCGAPGQSTPTSVFDIRLDNVRVESTREIGVPYCTAAPNSTGVAGGTHAIGSDVAAANDVVLRANSLPAGAFGIFVAARQPSNQPLASGVLCLGGTLGRYQGPGQLFTADANGTAELRIDLTRVPQAGATAAVSAGDRWYFQAWHRDTLAGGAPTANLSLPTRVDFR